MFDLQYMLTHPLLALIHQRCAELGEEASCLPVAQRKSIERRIARLEEYRLPKPDGTDRELNRTTVNQLGQKISQARSLRHRFKETRRGRSAKYRLQTRAALEDKLANPGLTWRDLSKKYGFSDAGVLERAVRILRKLLKQEGIPIPSTNAYHPPE